MRWTDNLYIIDEAQDLGTEGWIPDNNDGVVAVNEASVLESDLIAVSNALKNLGYDSGAYSGFNYDSGSTKGILSLIGISMKNID